MKKSAGYLLIFILIFFGVSSYYCQNTQEKIISDEGESASGRQEKTRIVLVNPDIGDLKSIIYLTENNIIEIP